MSFLKKRRPHLKRIWYLGIIGLFLLLLWPIEYQTTRAAFVLVLCLGWSGALILWWHKRFARATLMLVAALPLFALALPDRPHGEAALAADYIDILRTYRGVRYVWGGENHLGIDCSGLVRKALVWALASHGVRTLNGQPLRDAMELWWHDASASALGKGYRDWTTELFQHEDINSVDLARLKKGDLAVTTDGVHVLVYVGENLWIEADPDEKRVIEISVPAENPWFQCPVKLLRWKWLQTP